jgi:hypothetical protein
LHVCSTYVDSKDGAVIFFFSTFSWFKTEQVYKNITQQLELSQTPKELEKKERKNKKVFLRLHVDGYSTSYVFDINTTCYIQQENMTLAERRRLTSTWTEILSTCSVYCGKA